MKTVFHVGVVAVGLIAAILCLNLAGGSVAVVSKSVTEPLHLLKVLCFEILPANLLIVGALALLLLDSHSLAKAAPHAASRLFEQTKMVVISAVLWAQYTKLTGLASTLANATTGAILGAFGAAALGFAAVFIITLRRYLADRSRILSEIRNRSRHPQRDLAERSSFSWIRPVAIGSALVAVVIGGGLVAWILFPSARSAEEPQQKPVSAESPKPRPVTFQQEVVEHLTVGAQAQHGEGSLGESGQASLPEGLRFSWESGGLGWEPAFIKRSRDGTYWWRGQRIQGNAAILKAFALDGPAVRPDSSDGFLFFHRDVLARLHAQLSGLGGEAQQAIVSVDRQGDDVVLRIAGNSTQPVQTIVITARL